MSNKGHLMRGRYGLKHYLVQDSEDDYLYEFQVDKNSNYTRYIGDSKDNLEAVDPEGGPFISKGSKLLNKTVSSIFVDEDDKIFIRLE